MTDRLKGVYVAFEKDIRDDDASFIINAIHMIKGVADVSLNVADGDDWINRAQIRNELKDKFWKFYQDAFK